MFISRFRVIPLICLIAALVALPFLTTTLADASGSLKDLTYCTIDNVPLKLDLYLPQSSKPSPLVIYVHGGAWTTGSKDEPPRLAVDALLLRGYAFATVDYRLSPAYQFPAMIIDVKCAVRFLRAKAASYNLDPKHIGVVGASAGGHLVSLLGVTTAADDHSAGWDKGEYLDQSASVQAVVDLFGPTDMTLPGWGAVPEIQRVFGVTRSGDPALAAASPVTYITANAAVIPPFLILQGDKDDVVPPRQSVELYDRLKAAGVEATLVIVKNAGHGFVPSGGPINPSLVELVRMIGDFFDENLKTAD
jgi:acetyl esterase/lipase